MKKTLHFLLLTPLLLGTHSYAQDSFLDSSLRKSGKVEFNKKKLVILQTKSSINPTGRFLLRVII